MKSKSFFCALAFLWLPAGGWPESQEHPRCLFDEGHIAVLKHDGSPYDKLTPGGTPNFEPRMRVTREFIRTHGDFYDFIIIFTGFEFSRDGADGFAYLSNRRGLLGKVFGSRAAAVLPDNEVRLYRPERASFRRAKIFPRTPLRARGEPEPPGDGRSLVKLANADFK